MKPIPKTVTLTLDRRALQAAIDFLNRTDLKGHEVPVFFTVMSSLQRGLEQRPASPEGEPAPSA